MTVLYRPGVEGDWGIFESPAPGVALSQEWVTMDDKTRLHCRVWHADVPATLLIAHGLGAHGGWFVDMGNALASRGVNVRVIDHRGFGRSEGPRGHVTDYRRYLQDLDAVVGAIHAAQPGTRLFLLGHSLGAIFALYYAAAHSEKLSGIVLLNPWIKDQLSPAIGTVLAVAFRGIQKSPRLYRLAGGPAVMTTNAEALKLLEADPHWVREESASFFWQVTLMRGGVLKQARQVTLPALVLQSGRDKAVVTGASQEAFRRLGSADKTWKDYPIYAHDAEFEPDRSAMDDAIANWIKARVGAVEHVS